MIGPLSVSGGDVGRDLVNSDLLIGQTEIPFQREVDALGITHDALAIPAELGVMWRKEQKSGEHPLAKEIDQLLVTELRMHVPVRGDRAEIDDTNVAL